MIRLQRAMVVDQEFWDRLPVLVGQATAEFARKNITMTSKETGKDLDEFDRLEDYLIGLMASVVFPRVLDHA